MPPRPVSPPSRPLPIPIAMSAPVPIFIGANTGRHEPPNQDDVVLFVRGEVLLRYPTTIVYAAKAVKNPG